MGWPKGKPRKPKTETPAPPAPVTVPDKALKTFAELWPTLTDHQRANVRHMADTHDLTLPQVLAQFPNILS